MLKTAVNDAVNKKNMNDKSINFTIFFVLLDLVHFQLNYSFNSHLTADNLDHKVSDGFDP